MISLQTREPVETLRDRLTREGGLARIREQLRREKTGNLLVERLLLNCPADARVIRVTDDAAGMPQNRE